MSGGAPRRERHGTSRPKTNLAAVFRAALVPHPRQSCSTAALKPERSTMQQTISQDRPIVLTGDRPTGALHLGHYIGTLKSRIALQHTHRQYVLIADAQGLTDNAGEPERIRRNIIEVALDYLAVGIEPTQTTICVQSALPALSELTLLY